MYLISFSAHVHVLPYDLAVVAGSNTADIRLFVTLSRLTVRSPIKCRGIYTADPEVLRLHTTFVDNDSRSSIALYSMQSRQTPDPQTG